MNFRSAFIMLLVALVVVKWDYIRDELSPPPDFSAQHPEGVVLYATEWCGYCKKTRDFFRQHNIAYIEYDIEKSAEGRMQYEQLHGSGIPLIMVRGKVLRGYDPQALKAALTIQ